jgi:predicted permease
LLLAVTLLVLLVVCSNIANLLLARGTARGHEMAIRMAIGAGRGRLASQVLTEASLLAFIGGVASLAIAKATLLVIASFLPEALANELTPELSSAAVLFAMVLSLSTVLLFGLAPAVQAARSDSKLTVRRPASRSSTARGMTGLRNLLTTSQIAFSLVLLVLAGLFAQSLANVSRLDLGIDLESVVTFSVSPARNGYEANRVVTAYENIEGALAAHPGVTSVASARIPLIAGGGWIRLVQGLDAGPDVDLPTARVNELSPGFFRTIGVPLLQGRDFTDTDTADSTDVAIVNESFARRFSLGDDAIGERFRSGGPGEFEIVGVVADAASSGGSAKQDVGPQFYLSLDQIDPLSSQSRYFYVRSTDPESLARAIPRIVAEVEPNLPVDSLRTMEAQFETDIYIDRLVTALAGSFAIVAALLAGVGLYGMLSYTVAQRTRELGLRVALGAIPEQLRAMILKQVGVMTLVGCVVGIAAAIALGRAVEVLLFGISAADPSAFVAAVVLLSVIALAASYIPARRASSVAPMEALRYE